MEMWDIYDKDRILTGETMLRGDKFREDTYHLVVHVCIFNSQGEMLIQQRQPFKSGWSNMWDITVGGSAISGDTSKAAAEREVFEEIGYKLNLDHVRPSLTINFEGGFDDIYLIEDDVDINSLRLQYEEVQQVKWATKEEIIVMIESKEFIPYYRSFIDLLFDMRKYMGVHNKSNR
jgi:isopentenyldiphosphate isomerase